MKRVSNRKHHRPEEIVAKWREADEALAREIRKANSYQSVLTPFGADHHQRQSPRLPLQALPTRPAPVRLAR